MVDGCASGDGGRSVSLKKRGVQEEKNLLVISAVETLILGCRAAE